MLKTNLRWAARWPTLALVLSLIGLSACVGRSVAIAPSSSPLRPGTRGTIPTSGGDCQYDLLGLFALTRPASTQRALAEAKELADVEVLTDVTVDQRNYVFLILVTRSCIWVEGLGVKE